MGSDQKTFNERLSTLYTLNLVTAGKIQCMISASGTAPMTYWCVSGLRAIGCEV